MEERESERERERERALEREAEDLEHFKGFVEL